MARIASAELLKFTHSVEGRVMGIDAHVGKRVEIIDSNDQLDYVNRSLSL
jgi:hypothetical protein